MSSSKKQRVPRPVLVSQTQSVGQRARRRSDQRSNLASSSPALSSAPASSSSSSSIGATELMRAATQNDPLVIARLLNREDVLQTLFATDNKGRTALDWARICRNYLAISMILKAITTQLSNARIETIVPSVHSFEDKIRRVNEQQRWQLHKALFVDRNEELSLQILCNSPVTRLEVEALGNEYFCDTPSGVRYTPLHLASALNMRSLVQQLVQLKVPIDATNKFGHSALTLAASAGNADVVHFLLFSGANIHLRTAEEGRTALHFACMYAKAKVVRVIMDFLLEQFAVFRIEGHAMIDFDFTRWTTYCSILESLINARDTDGNTCEELLPVKLANRFDLEKRLKLSGITGLPALQETEDIHSTRTNYSFIDDVNFIDNHENVTLHMRLQDSLHDCDVDWQRERAQDAALNEDLLAQCDQDLLLGNGNSQMLKTLDRSRNDNEDSDAMSVVSDLSGNTPRTRRHPPAAPDRWEAISYNEQHNIDDYLHKEVEGQELNDLRSIAEFSHDTDNQMVTNYVRDIDSVYTSLPLQDEIQVIRSIFDRVRDRIGLWKSNAQKEKALAELIPCPLECGTICKVEDMTSHVRDDCTRRTLQCAACHQIIVYRDISEHEKKSCGKRVVGCPNAMRGCRELLTADNVDFHCRLQCVARWVPCRLFCSAKITAAERDDHEIHFCRNRIIRCDQCQEDIIAHSYSHHLQQTCPNRLILCSVGCGQKFQAKIVKDHEENECKRVCCWPNCNRVIGPPVLLSVHERIECGFHPETCCFSCTDVPGLIRKYKKQHESHQCSLRKIPCDLGCGQQFVCKDREKHQHEFLGSCEERIVRCPSNLVHWRVLLVSVRLDVDQEEAQSCHDVASSSSAVDIEGIVLKYERRINKQSLRTAYALYPTAQQESSQCRSDSEFTDDLYVKTSRGHFWVNVWTTEIVFMENTRPSAAVEHIRDHFACGYLPFSKLSEHLVNDCNNRKIILANETDKLLQTAGQKVSIADAIALAKKKVAMDKWMGLTSPSVIEYVTNKIAASVAHSLNPQLSIKNNPDIEMCPFCGRDMDCSALEDHILHICTEFIHMCPLGCGEQILRKDLETHTKTQCRKRNVCCPLCGDDELWDEELNNHIRNLCLERIVVCPLHCGLEDLTARRCSQHVAEECPLRSIQCSCGLFFCAKDFNEHLSLNCIDRIVNCTQGCGLKLPYRQLEDHMDSVCPNRYHILQKQVECPQGCGRQMMRRELLEHCTFQCEKRLVECPQGCGNTSQLDMLATHLITCPQRIMSCEPGMKQCSRCVHEWFFKPIVTHKRTGRHDSSAMVSQDSNVKSMTDLTLLDRVDSIDMASSQYDNSEMDDDNSWRTSSHMSAARDSIVKSKSRTATARSIGPGKSNVLPSYGSKMAIGISLAQSDADTMISDSSSVYMDGSAMKFREQLRMVSCQYHKCTAIMSTIKYNDYQLAEFLIKQLQECEDIDLENIFGDTALTLACRLGKFEFVKLIVQNGADVNKETSNGRTALIEAVKADEEHIEIIEYLIEKGAMVAYKTHKHARTALDWGRRFAVTEAMAISARNQRILERRAPERLQDLDILSAYEQSADTDDSLGAIETSESINSVVLIDNGAMIVPAGSPANKSRPPSRANETAEEAMEELVDLTEEYKRLLGRPRTVRVLELATIVQRQLNMLFHKISTGDMNWIGVVLKDGDFFHPNNESMAYVEMDKFALQATETDKQITVLQVQMSGMSKTVEAALIQHKIVVDKVRDMDKQLRSLYESERQLENAINSSFQSFEGLCGKLQAIDLLEVFTCKSPSNTLLVCVFALAVAFDLFGQDSNTVLEDGTNAVASGEPTGEVPSWTMERIVSSKSRFWPLISPHFTRPQALLRRMQTYSRAKLHLDRSAKLLRQMRTLLSILLTNSARNAPQPEEKPLDIDSESPGRGSPGKSRNKKIRKRRSSSISEVPRLTPQESQSKIVTELIIPEAIQTEFVLSDGTILRMEDAIEEERKRKEESDRRRKRLQEELDQQMRDKAAENWGDDEDEEEVTGEWIRGEWVAKVRKREPQTQREDTDSLARTDSVRAMIADDDEDLNAEQRRQKAKQKELKERTVFVTDDAIQQEMNNTKKDTKAFEVSITSMLGIEDVPPSPERSRGRSRSRRASRSGKGDSSSAQVSPPRSPSRSRSPSMSPSPSRSKSRSPSRRTSKQHLSQSSFSSGLSMKDSNVFAMFGTKDSTVNDSIVDAFLFDSGLPETASTKKLPDNHPLRALDRETDVGYALMEAAVCLLTTLCRFHSFGLQVQTTRSESLSLLKEIEALKIKNSRLQEIYQNEYELRSTREKEYIKLLKRSRFLHEKVEAFKGKVRVARLLNHVSVNGHSPLSWAASYGSYDIVELMLSRGSPIGFNAKSLHLVATFLQRSYKIYRMLLAARYDRVDEVLRGSKYSANEKAKLDINIVKYVPKIDKMARSENVSLIRRLTGLKIDRGKILDLIRHARHSTRFAATEAAYTGKWELLWRIQERRLLQHYFLQTWMYPAAPPPFLRHWERIYDHHVIPLNQCAILGANDLAAGCLMEGSGWHSVLGDHDPHSETIIKVNELLIARQEKIDKFVANRARIRLLQKEAMNQRTGEQAMEKAIQAKDYWKCLALARDRGITIDLETSDGQSLLIAAAEEDVSALNYKPLTNDDGSDCLAVALLLDRKVYRPSIDLETTPGLTALIRACSLGRAEVVVALLDRGADINKTNKQGRTALHFAAVCGHSTVLRILLERFADMSIKDNNGHTAYDLAERENYANLMTTLSQFKSGNIGGLQLTRGRVNNLTLCSLGCGLKLRPVDNAQHIAEECPLRQTSCPNNCGDHDLMFRDVSKHLQEQCPLRMVMCDCKVEVAAKDLDEHKRDFCALRELRCFLDCEKIFPYRDMEKHLRLHCSHRMVPCPLQCRLQPHELQSALPAVPVSGESNSAKGDDCVDGQNEEEGEGDDILLCQPVHQQITFKLRKRFREVVTANDRAKDAMLAILQSEIQRESESSLLRFMRHCDVKHHVDKVCANRRVVCPNKCHSVIIDNQLPKHLAETCTHRRVDCQFCHELVMKKDQVEHESMQCPMRLVLCRDKCGELVPFAHMDMHLTTVCAHQMVMCPLGCAIKIQRRYVSKHTECDCKQRQVRCPNGCVDESSTEPSTELSIAMIPAFRLDQHLKHECTRRPVRCSQCHAAVTVPYCDLQRHQQEDCANRMVSCRNEGCSKSLLFCDREFHEVAQCRFRRVDCPQACGERIIFQHTSVHTQRECIKRIADCVLGCGMKVKWLEMDVHTSQECLRRFTLQQQQQQQSTSKSTKSSTKAAKALNTAEVTIPRAKTPQELRSEELQEESAAVLAMRAKLASSGKVSSTLSGAFADDRTAVRALRSREGQRDK